MKKYKSYFKSISIVLIVQATIYFAIKLLLSNYNVITSLMSFPFIKWFVYFYDSWYPVVAINAFIIYKYDKDNYKKLIYTMLLGAFISHITFLIYPTILYRDEISVKTLTDLVLYITYKTDTPAVNCLPSVHCLFCFILMYYTMITKKLEIKYKIPIIIYLFVIVLSTVLIKQHIIEDAILALIYTIIVIIFVGIFKDKLNKLFRFLF